jgi:starch synthase
MYSMRYGTVPVVRATGGLADSVEPVDLDADTGQGFVFQWFDGRSLLDALRHALRVWRARPEAFARVQKRAMEMDFSWDAVVPRYEEIYRRAAAARGMPLAEATEPAGSNPPPKRRRRG